MGERCQHREQCPCRHAWSLIAGPTMKRFRQGLLVEKGKGSWPCCSQCEICEFWSGLRSLVLANGRRRPWRLPRIEIPDTGGATSLLSTHETESGSLPLMKWRRRKGNKELQEKLDRHGPSLQLGPGKHGFAVHVDLASSFPTGTRDSLLRTCQCGTLESTGLAPVVCPASAGPPKREDRSLPCLM